MKIAAAVSARELAGLDDAAELVIYDTNAQSADRIANPATALRAGKRLAAVELLLGHDVDIVAAVPDGFCAVSHAIAQAAGIRFLPLERGTAEGVIERHGAVLATTAQPELPPSWLARPATMDEPSGQTEWLSDRAAGALRNRLRRLEGQARGLQRLLDERASLDDILTQLAAMRAALNAVGLTLLAENLADCLTTTAAEPGDDDRLAAARRAFLRLN
ncbi:MAG: metal-sensing transcriptional repressor [Thermomicrobiales bacterium]